MDIQSLKPFLERICCEPLGELGGIAADWARYYRHKNLYSIFDRWERLCEERGIVPDRKVAPKVLLPILEAASYEDDAELQELWARLIASGTNSAGTSLHPAFAEILKQITPLEARLLTSLYRKGNEDLFSSTIKNDSVLGRF